MRRRWGKNHHHKQAREQLHLLPDFLVNVTLSYASQETGADLGLELLQVSNKYMSIGLDEEHKPAGMPK